jgi:hypothetical protein
MADTAPPQYGENDGGAGTVPPPSTTQAGPYPTPAGAPPPFEGTAQLEKFPQQPQYRDAGWIFPFVAQLIGK